MKQVDIYTDGACSGNPGKGGWGAILMYEGKEKHISGAQHDTTNNQMELMAVIQALECLKFACCVHIYTDSQYVQKGMQTWLAQWKKNGWRTANKAPVKNQALWQRLDALQGQHEVYWHWVKGHSGHPLNEAADALARQAILLI